MYREERIDQELKRLKAVQEVAQYRAEAQASRRLLEHQKSVARVSVGNPTSASMYCVKPCGIADTQWTHSVHSTNRLCTSPAPADEVPNSC